MLFDPVKQHAYAPVFKDLNERHVVLNADPDYRKKMLALIDLLLIDFSTGEYDIGNRVAHLSCELVEDLIDLRGCDAT